MKMTSNTKPKKNIKEAFIEEAKKAFVLTIYLAVWFCALSFLAATLLDERPIPWGNFGFAFVKAAITAKFLLIGQAIYPISVNKAHGIFRSLLIESFVYLLIVLGLNYVEAGIDGLIHGKQFIESMSAFGQDNPLKVLAVSIVYWLIVWPYLILAGMQMIMGQAKTLELFFGERSSANQ